VMSRLPRHLFVKGSLGHKAYGDHPFWENDFRAVMVTDTAFFRNPHYHQPSDTVATLDLEFIRDIATGLAAYLIDPAG